MVNEVADEPDLDWSDGECDSSVLDGPQCTLRAAIETANASGVGSSVRFDFSTAGSTTIHDGQALSEIQVPLVIEGEDLVTLSRASAGADTYGLVFRVAGSILRGLAVEQFSGHGVVASGAAGFEAVRARSLNNGKHGLLLEDSRGALLGGFCAADGNEFADNDSSGVAIRRAAGASNRVLSNTLRGNDRFGVAVVASTGVEIGSDLAGTGNQIARNDSAEVSIRRGSADAKILGNEISENGAGVQIRESTDTIVGGRTADSLNAITDNFGSGVSVVGSSSLRNEIRGKEIKGNLGIPIDLDDDARLPTISAICFLRGLTRTRVRTRC